MLKDPIGTAAINWFDANKGLHVRVYSTDGYTVTERCIDAGGKAWTTGGFKAPGSAVSAMCWQDSGGEHLRVYCTFEDMTTEYCWDGGHGWTKGAYTVA